MSVEKPRDTLYASPCAHVKPVATLSNEQYTCWSVDVAQRYDASSLYRTYCKPEWFGKLLAFSVVWTVLPPTTSNKLVEGEWSPRYGSYLLDSLVWLQVSFITYQSREQFSHASIKRISRFIYKFAKKLINIIFLVI